ncbi:MAG: BACON domain-containing protein [Candidatus Cryptobacteroides sp.]
MKRFYLNITCLTASLLSLAFLSGCKPADTEPDRFNIDETDIVLQDASEGFTDILLSTNTQPSASVEQSAEGWLSAEITRRCLTLAYKANESEEERTGKVHLTAGSILMSVTVTQPGYIAPDPDPDPTPDPTPDPDPDPDPTPDPTPDPDPDPDPTPDPDPVETKFKVYRENDRNVGLVYWTSEDGMTSMVMSIKRSDEIPWSNDGSHILNATSLDDGMANTETLKAGPEAGSIPALAFCESLGEGWYWPALNEMVAIFDIYNGVPYAECVPALPGAITDAEKTAREEFDASLKAFGGDIMNAGGPTDKGDRYWTSTEYVSGEKAYGSFMTFGKAYKAVPADTPGKTNSSGRYARCIKVITNNQ